MNSGEIVTIITSALQAGGLATFFWLFIRGLRRQISGLNETIDAQQKTLEVMERRVLETQKVGEIYKSLIQEIPETLDHYKKMHGKIAELKDEAITELESAGSKKDAELKALSESRLTTIQSLQLLLGEVQESLAQRKALEIPPVLLINTAQYGAEGMFSDVTQSLRAGVINGRLDLVVSNSKLGGDPIWGVVKTLSVDYELNGEHFSKEVAEGEILSLP